MARLTAPRTGDGPTDHTQTVDGPTDRTTGGRLGCLYRRDGWSAVTDQASGATGNPRVTRSPVAVST